MQNKMKAIGLFSGGLDSLLAIKLIQEQGIEVVVVPHQHSGEGNPGPVISLIRSHISETPRILRSNWETVAFFICRFP